MDSFVKWVGGKSKIFPHINKLKPKKFNKYIEPFVGSGCVFLNLENTSKIIISDLNHELINAYICIKENYLKLIDAIEKINKIGDYYKIREMDKQKNYCKLDKYIKAARLIYLNKNCFNGIYRVNSLGFFNVPKGRYKKVTLYHENTLKNINIFLNTKKVKIYNKNFIDMKEYIKEKDFIYLDPPYDPINKTQSFTSYNPSGFSKQDQIDLKNFCDYINKKGAYFMLSNNNTDLIQKLYKNCYITKVCVTILKVFKNKISNSFIITW